MARIASLAQLLLDVRWQCDSMGASAQLRHTDQDVTRAINQSIQDFRLKVSQKGSRKYLVNKTGVLPVGPTPPFAFGVLSMAAWDPQLVGLFGFDITVNGRIVPLELVPFDMRNDFQRVDLGASVNATPVAVAQYGPENLAVLPASEAAYAFNAWYLPVAPDLEDPGDAFDGVAGWEQWIVWDVCSKLTNRDTFSKAYQLAVAERERVWLDVAAACPSKQIGVVRRFDSRALRIDRLRMRRNWVDR